MDKFTTAARWWAEQLKAPSFDNGQDDLAGSFASKLVEPLSEAQLDIFVNELISELKNKSGDLIVIYTDYSPDITLSNAMKKADICEDNAPWKTSMFIEKDSIEVASGLGAKRQQIYPTNTVEPQINSTQQTNSIKDPEAILNGTLFKISENEQKLLKLAIGQTMTDKDRQKIGKHHFSSLSEKEQAKTNRHPITMKNDTQH